MKWAEFSLRFPDEIGRDIMHERNEDHVYFTNDNGDIGIWIINKGNTVGEGRQLFGEDAENCRAWCKQSWAERVKRQEQGRER